MAGPEVFLPNALEIGRQKSQICADYGLNGLFPLDGNLDLEGLGPQQQARRISLANEDLMRNSDAIIANMTPFRGAAMDSGTAFEVGFMRALGRPVFGYTNIATVYADRVRHLRSIGLPGDDYDAPDVDIEDFGLVENLMIAVAVSETGPDVVRHASTGAGVRYDLDGFHAAVAGAARVLIQSQGPRQ
jgi:nucleoside 2-deoxyribosyltransferase